MSDFIYKRDKKTEELKTAKYFLDFLNVKYGYKFYPESNLDETNPQVNHIDVWGIDELKLDIKINLQIVLCDKDYYREAANRSKNLKEIDISVRDIKTEEWVVGSIEKKYKKYNLKQRKELILLIHGSPQNIIDSGYLLNNIGSVKDYDFAGVYFVVPDWCDIDGVIQKGKIITIKDFDFKK